MVLAEVILRRQLKDVSSRSSIDSDQTMNGVKPRANAKRFHLCSTERNFPSRVFALERGASAAAGDWSDRCLRNDWIVTQPSGIDDDSRKSALRQGRMHIKPIGLLGFISCLIYADLSRQIPAGRTQPSLGDLPWLRLRFTLSKQSGTFVISIDPFHIYTAVTLAHRPRRSPFVYHLCPVESVNILPWISPHKPFWAAASPFRKWKKAQAATKPVLIVPS